MSSFTDSSTKRSVDHGCCLLQDEAAGRDCVLECGPDKTCYPETCCAVRKKSVKGSGAELTSVVSAPVGGGPHGIRQRSNGSGSGGAASATRSVQSAPPGVDPEALGQENAPVITESTQI